MAVCIRCSCLLGLLCLWPITAKATEPVSQEAAQAVGELSMPAGTDFEVGALQRAAFHQPSDGLAAAACCAPPPWAHRSGASGELLLLRARDAEIAYALPVNGNVPEGPVGVLDPEFDLGFRVGLTRALNDYRSLTLAYTGFFSEQSDRLDATAPRSLSKLLVHPNELNAAANVPQAKGAYEIDFQTADLTYRFLALSSECTAANFVVGGRYARLDQELAVEYSGAGLTEGVTSEIGFDGAGFLLGGDIEHHGRGGLFCYGKTSASFLAGEFQADYLHASDVDPVRVSTSWEAGRILSILDLEIGAGWQCGSNWRLSAGYTFSHWIGTVNTDEWISRVRSNDVRDMSDSLTFDGLVARAEYRF